ncbi:glycosyltransferase [Pontibacter indicus]|uniref:Glycosyltransferase involved in cell wall bisynthesis n=1 Tax=Pontibacter indicus TaxID=1317125 RepID=A0A1R3XIL6_9BACT|nr:glycosyltransferase [Pontibacter indicus]SIT90706.1 Glycosyltransferase involved in cell wall bisynthesis [Pontibacter indicus]
MNVFVIPSWYPSKDNPHTGIFNKEQSLAVAELYPESNFAISTWGTHENDLLLLGKDHLKNISKLFKYPLKKATTQKLGRNITEYYTPAFTWTRKFLRGNINNIIKVNVKHFQKFQEEVGKVDIIHAHSAHPGGWVAMMLAEKFAVPYTITEHMAPFPFRSFLKANGTLNQYLAKPFHYSAANIVVSPQQKETLTQWDIPRLKLIPNLTDESVFQPKHIPKTDQRFTFFTLAVLEDRKGIKFLLEAFKRIHEQYKNTRLIIGGDGPQRQEYQSLASSLSITEHVQWLGTLNRQQAAEQLQNCDAFVLPSFHENLPLVLLEASACGKPLIGTYCGGSESIIHDKNGLVVEPGNTDALFGAMEDLYLNYERYNAKEIRANFMSKYSRSVVCKQIMDLYQQVITQHTPSP